MPSSSPGEGRKLSRLRRWTAKRTARLRLKLKLKFNFLRHSKSQSAASSSSYSDRLLSLTQSAEHYPHLKALADSVNVLYSNVNQPNSSKKQQALGWRCVEILEAVAEAIQPDHPSQISDEMCRKISHLTTSFCDINRDMHTSTPLQIDPLRSQLDAAYSKFVRGKEPRTLKTLRKFRTKFSMASVADILTTTLRVIDRASDVFPPLKSTVGGALAFMDVTQGVHAIKTRAQQLRQNISNILDIIPSDSVDVSDYLKSLHHMLQQLDELELHKQSFFMRLRNFNRNNELLSTSQADVDRGMFYSLLIRAFRPPESSRFPRTKDYVFFSASLAFF
ncbi:hypothetical protein K435DRAFT_779186 [Dendrothele bispora CBS 962.96]|uniref:Fungal STAND N-terminal Goodbye domain-containing protein n=1 Tax=Dendrothele bispora (strain CBS 962.96) TaxID=1314807 RepID=A0A4S8LZ56_DENBC|nr:hypothetical protein K435DRAFT_779186 [Dendrothele bispora CBS 962.96]